MNSAEAMNRGPALTPCSGPQKKRAWLMDETDRTEFGWVVTWHLFMGNVEQARLVCR